MIKRLLFIFIPISLLIPGAQAQVAEQADEAFRDGNYFKAAELYGKLLEEDSTNVEYHLRAGLSHLSTDRAPGKAAPHLEKALESEGIDQRYHIDLARAYMHHHEYGKAEKSINKYLKTGTGKRSEEAEKMLRDCQAAKELMSFPVDVDFMNAGQKVNTEYPEYNAFIDVDETRLVYTTRRKTSLNPQPEFDGYYPSDIMIALKESTGFSQGKSVGANLNTQFDEQVVGMTNSGDSIFIYLDHINDYGDVYLSQYESTKYQRPIKIEGEINSGYLEASATISPDGNTIVFSSNRNGDENFDLYMARKLPDGTWGKIQSLGDEVNTPFNENYPNFSPDGKTIYFASDGHAGMGGYDIFFTNWEPVSNSWSRPQNVGYPINTSSDDRTISFTQDKKHAYVASIREEGYGDLDIYRVTFNERVTDPAIFRVSVNSEDTTKTAPTPEINIKNEYDELIGRYLPSKYTDKYIFALYPGRYYVYIDAQGYSPYNEMMIVNDYHTRQQRNIKEITLDKAD